MWCGNRSKHGAIFGVSVDPQKTTSNTSMNEYLRSEHVDVHMMDVDQMDVDHQSYQDLLRVSRKEFVG